MSLEPIDDVLPLFQGQRPDASRLRLTGGTDSTLHRAYALDQQVFFVIRASVSKVGHVRDDKAGLVREQTLKVDGAWDLRSVWGIEEVAALVKQLQEHATDVYVEVFGGQPTLPQAEDPEDGEP